MRTGKGRTWLLSAKRAASGGVGARQGDGAPPWLGGAGAAGGANADSRAHRRADRKAGRGSGLESRIHGYQVHFSCRAYLALC